MRINKLSIASFGKLSGREYQLKDGLNVIYGPNESGKSTLISFMRFMLFGSHGRKSANNITFEEKYSPWDNTTMAGSMEFELDGTMYHTARSHGVRKEYSTINKLTGDLRFEGIAPGEVIYKMNESAFLRSFYMSSASCAISADKNDDILKGLSNLSDTGDESLSYETLSSAILSDKKQTVSKIGETESEIMSLRKSLERIGSLKERAKALEKSLDNADSSIDTISSNIDNKIDNNDKYQQLLDKYASARLYQQAKVIIFVLMTILLVVMCAFSMFSSALCVGIIDLLTVLLMYTGSKKIKRLKKQLVDLKRGTMEYAEDVKKDLQSTDQKKSEILKELGAIEAELEKEYSYDDISSRIDYLTNQKEQLDKKVFMLEKSKYILDTAYSELKALFSPMLNKKASEIFCAITGEKYSDIMISDSFDIKAKSEFDYKPSQMFSASTYEMMYFALRLALCDILCESEKLPVFLDDCFALCDDERAKSAIKFLSEYASSGRQIVFCTCHNREKQLFQMYGNANVIELG